MFVSFEFNQPSNKMIIEDVRSYLPIRYALSVLEVESIRIVASKR